MRILFVTDVHEAVGYVDRLADIAGGVDLLLLGGDLTNFGRATEMTDVLGAFRARFGSILGVHGNLDHREAIGELEQSGLSLHGRGVVHDGVALFGAGGSNVTPMRTPSEYSEEEIARVLKAGLAAVGEVRPRILVSHTPPQESATDRIYSGKHVGSSAVRRLLESGSVDLCLCGHIHESHAIDHVGDADVCNPGAFAAGRYAVVDVDAEGGQIDCTLARLDVGTGEKVGVGAKVISQKVVGMMKHKLGR